MKKLILSLALTLVMLVGFSACNGHTHTFDQKKAEDAFLKDPANESSAAVYYYSCDCGEKGEETFTFGSPIGGEGNKDEGNKDEGTAGEEHTFKSEWSTNEEKHWHDCADLNCEVREGEAVHTFGEWITDEEATCKTAGSKHRTCSVCGKTASEDIPINASAHNYAAAWTSDDDSHWHICQNSGCSNISSLGAHTFNAQGTCTVCQKVKESDLEFTKNGDGTYCVSGYTGSDTELIIPSTYNGAAVTSIGIEAFSGCQTLKSITIPSSVKSIGIYAFYECSSLMNIHIPEGVVGIGENTFYGCSALTSITIPSSVTSIDSFAFYNCSSLSSVTFSQGSHLTSIGFGAFNSCSDLKSIVIPESVKTIDSGAFYGCASLTSVTLQGGIESIGEWAFSFCESLTAVHIKDIAAWCNISFGGASANPLYNEKAKLYLNGELVTILTIPEEVQKIGNYAFVTLTDLVACDIPKSVKSIGVEAFSGCTKLSTVNYGGTVAEWKGLGKGSDWKYNAPTITVYCNGAYTDEE